VTLFTSVGSAEIHGSFLVDGAKVPGRQRHVRSTVIKQVFCHVFLGQNTLSFIYNVYHNRWDKMEGLSAIYGGPYKDLKRVL
jgi:hypothetical protein